MNYPNTMNAVALTQYLPIEHPNSLMDVVIDTPFVGDHDLLVQIKGLAVNPADYKIRSPKEQVESRPRVLGWDAAGVVVAKGALVSGFSVGDEVFYAGAINRPGANSQYHAVDYRIVGRKPKKLDFAHAAALPLTSLTAWELLERMGVSASSDHKTLLIIGGAGGVPSMLIQLAKLMGKTVIATASRPESSSWVKKLGADYVVNSRQNLVQSLDVLGFKQVDAIANTVDTNAYWSDMLELIAPEGSIGLIVEPSAPVDIAKMHRKSVRLVYELMFTRSLFLTSTMTKQAEILNQVAQLIEGGKIQPTVSQVFDGLNAHNLKKMHALLESKSTIGKLVLKV